jgi:hypothetical protein
MTKKEPEKPVGTVNGIVEKAELEEGMDLETGNRILRRIISRDPSTGKPTCVVEQRRADVTNKLLFYCRQTLNPKNGQIIVETAQRYCDGRLRSWRESTPTSSLFKRFHRRTGVMVWSEEEERNNEGALTFLVEKKFDHETGVQTLFDGTKYNPETGESVSWLHETFDSETGNLTCHKEFEYNLATREWKLVAEVIPSQSSQEQP